MTNRGAYILAISGTVGLLSLGALVTVGNVPGRFATGERLTLASCGPRSPQGTIMHVDLTDRGAMMGERSTMMASITASPNVVSSGLVTFVATNTGTTNHELLVLPRPVDGVGTRAVGNDGKIDEVRSLGEASTSCGSGSGNGISPGASSWVSLHLAPGNYELLCDIPWHYANGMFAGFTVQ